MLVGKDIVVVGQQAWDTDIGSNCKNIAMEFSKKNRVLYVNSPLDRITKIRRQNDPKTQRRLRVINGEQNGLIEVSENLWTLYPNIVIESINWIRIPGMFKFLNRQNNIRFSETIYSALKSLNFEEFILFNDSDMFRSFYLKELLSPSLSIYYSRDNLMATKYWRRHGRRWEPLLIKQSDICVSNSEYLAAYCKRYNINSHYVGQGCDIELFKEFIPKNKPAIFNDINKPIIGYVGALTIERLDIDIIHFVATQQPDHSIVLVGPEDNAFKQSKLHKLHNVFFIGSVRTDELPSYIYWFDICINPQKINELTIGNYPRKVDEYLAMGKPIVATRTETMNSFQDHVYLASDKYEFEASIEQAIKEDSEELRRKRTEFASSHTWDNSVRKILCLIDNHISVFE